MTRIFLTLAAAASLTLTAGCKESVSDKAFGERVRAYLLEHPEVLRETAEALDRKDAAEAFKKATAAIDKHRHDLERDPRDFVANPNGKITVVQFFDYNCGYCKAIAPEVESLIKTDPNVRVVFKELPVVGGPVSERASRVALGLQRSKGDYFGLYDAFIKARPLDNAAIERITAARGLNAAALEQAGGDDASRHIMDNKLLAQALGLTGTPMFVVGDEIVEGANAEKLKQAIAKAKG